ncbi:MAG: DUF932 domain-containing protein [Methanothrix sp.]|nr:DUF932 domain-containing protein [Methanothrix sp.]
MSHDLFGERFLSNRQPAWHGLGLIVPEGVSATEAFSRLTPYDVELQGLRLESGKKIEQRAVVRQPVPDDPEEVVFGIVGKDYTLIPPIDICRIWDDAVARPVETIGALGRGEILFVSTYLPEFDIKGDPVESYLLLTSPYSGWEALNIRVTPVRVKCRNTLIAAKQQSSEVYRVVHDRTAYSRLESWLSGIYQRAVQRSETLASFFNIFADLQVQSDTLSEMINEIYPYPTPPRENAPKDVVEKRMMYYLENKKILDKSRLAVQELFEGGGTTLDTPACRGTGWGLYNAVVEWEDYRMTKSEEARAKNALFGDRAYRKELAFAVVADRALSK